MTDMESKAAEMPYYRWEGFYAHGNGDVTFHILVVEGDGGRVIADGISGRAEAEWIAKTLTDALPPEQGNGG